MAFSSTTDSRTHVMGDLVMFTGDWDAAGVTTGSIMGDTYGDVTGGGVDGAFAIVADAAPGTLVVDCVSANTGSWWALGKR